MLLPRYKRMVTWKLVEPLLTPHRRYPDKMTSPFVWKSIASTFPLPLGSEEYPQFVLVLLDRLRQQSQLARGKNNYLITCPTIPNVCLFVSWCFRFCFFDSWTEERVERLRFFSLKEPFFVRCPNYSAKVCWICSPGVKEHERYTKRYKTDRHCANKSFMALIGGTLCFLVVDTHWYILCKMDVCWFSLVASFYGK